MTIPVGTTPESTEPLLDVAELAVWCRRAIDADDPLANAIINVVSYKTRDVAKQPEWGRYNAPVIPELARQIAIQLARRTYLNPDSVIAEGGLGPIGGDRYIEDYARALEFTPSEAETLAGMAPAGAVTGAGILWVQSLTRGDLEVGSTDVYAFDDSGSDWAIPLRVDGPVAP